MNFRRTPADSVNTLEAESVIFAGKAPQLGEWRQNAWRWGDYSAMSIDPVDDRTFWYTNEYVTSRHFKPNWSTRIASFKFPGCATP